MKLFGILHQIMKKVRIHSKMKWDFAYRVIPTVCCMQKSKLFARGCRALKKLIFHFFNFFCWGHFLIHHFWKIWSKNDPSQKNFASKKKFLSYASTTYLRKCFWNLSFIFKVFCQSFDIAGPNHFWGKILKMVAINSKFLIVWRVEPAPESPARW